MKRIKYMMLVASLLMPALAGCEVTDEKPSKVEQETVETEKEENPRDHWLDEAELIGDIDKETQDWLYDIVKLVDEEDIQGLKKQLVGEFDDEMIKESLRPRRITGEIQEVFGIQKFEPESDQQTEPTYYILAQGEHDALGILVSPTKDGELAAFQLIVEQDQEVNQEKYADQIAQAKSLMEDLKNGDEESYVAATADTLLDEDVRRATFNEMRQLMDLAGEEQEVQISCIERRPLDKIESESMDGLVVEISVAQNFDELSMIEHFYVFDEEGTLHDIKYQAFQ